MDAKRITERAKMQTIIEKLFENKHFRQLIH